MSVAHDISATGNNGTGATTVVSATLTAGAARRLLIAVIAITNATSQTVSSISGGSLTWALITSISNGTLERVEVWGAYTTGSFNAAVTATLSASAAAAIVVSAYSGTKSDVSASMADSIGITNTATGSSNAPTLNLTAGYKSSLVIGGLSALLATSATAGSGQTINGQDTGTTNPRTAQSRQNAGSAIASTVTSNWSLLASVSWAAAAIEIRAANEVNSVFCCGFECGVSLSHWSPQSGAATFATSSPLTGSRSLRCAPSTSPDGYMGTISNYGTAGILVFRFRVKFTTLPDNTTCIASGATSSLAGAYFNSVDSKIYAGTGTAALGATGVGVIVGGVYDIDVRVSTAVNPWLVDVQVNGDACDQRSSAITAEVNAHFIQLGFLHSCTADALFDDVTVSATSADFPIGPGQVFQFIPTSDGTHNIAGTGDFQRGNSGTDILNATTTAFQLIDDIPLPSGAVDEADNQRAVAPPNATDYPECVFGPAAGIATPTVGPRSVEVILAHHQISTAVGQMIVELNDNGTVNTIFDTGAAAGVVTYRYARKHYATAPSVSTPWGAASGNGNFNNVRCRFRSPDPAPDQCLDAIMIEAEFAPNLPPALHGRPEGQGGQRQMSQILSQ